MIVPNSNLVSGQTADGVVIPGNGTETYQVNLTAPSDSIGDLCNSAVVVAPSGYQVAPEVDVPLTVTCDSTPWPIGP